MGWYIRKSKNIGPVRINLSKSGIGVSTGIKGARISTGPKGTYLHAGSNGLYYRKKIGGNSQKTRIDSPTKLGGNNKLPARVILLLVLASFLLVFTLIVLADIPNLKNPSTAIVPCIASGLFFIGSIIVIGGYKQDDFRRIKTGRIILVSSVILFALSGMINNGLSSNSIHIKSANPGANSASISVIIIVISIIIGIIASKLSWNLSESMSYEDSLTQMIRKSMVVPSASFLAAFALLLIGFFGIGNKNDSIFSFLFLLGVVLLLWTVLSLFIFRAKLNYSLDSNEQRQWDELCAGFALLKDSKTVWAVHDRYDSGISARKSAVVHLGADRKKYSQIVADCTICFIQTWGCKYLFLPDRIVVIKGWRVKSFPFEYVSLSKNMEIAAGKSNKYSDAGIHLQSMHWLHETKDGGPDLRFKNNPMTVAYELEAIEFSCDYGFWLKVLISRAHIRDIVAEKIEKYLRYFSVHAEAFREFDEDENDEIPEESSYENQYGEELTRGQETHSRTQFEGQDNPSLADTTSDEDIPSEDEPSDDNDALFDNLMNFFHEE